MWFMKTFHLLSMGLLQFKTESEGQCPEEASWMRHETWMRTVFTNQKGVVLHLSNYNNVT